MKKYRWITIVPVTLAIVFEALPWGAVLVFMGPEGEDWRSLCSYFSLTPFGFANFGPLITAVLSCVLLVLTILGTVWDRKALWGWSKGLCYVAVAASLGPLVLGLRFYSVIGAAISVVLLGEALLLARMHRRCDIR